ncbi:MAG: metallophosphoesterase [Candidatus Kapabacteria bacterium]|nr:metallophosphoesterase [Candidatus Kapabacteria bacterium]
MNKKIGILLLVACVAILYASCVPVATLPIPVYPVHPPPHASQTIVLVGDTQETLWEEFWREQNDSLRQQLFSQIVTHNPMAIVLMGDMVGRGSNTTHWQYFDRISSAARNRGIMFIPTMGNHDYMGHNASCFANIRPRFPLLDSAMNNNHTWYAVEVDSVAFIILDSNFDELTEDQFEDQQMWLDSTLLEYNTNDAVTNVVLICHHPGFTNSTIVDGDRLVQNLFIQDALDFSFKITLIASGHAHTYEHFTIDDNVHIVVSGGGGGPRQRLLDTKHARYPDVYNGGTLRDFNYVTVQRANGDELTVTMMRYNESTKTWTVGEKFTCSSETKLE